MLLFNKFSVQHMKTVTSTEGRTQYTQGEHKVIYFSNVTYPLVVHMFSFAQR